MICVFKRVLTFQNQKIVKQWNGETVAGETVKQKNTSIRENLLKISENQSDQKQVEDYCLNLPKVKSKMAGKPLKKTIFVAGKSINFVT